MSTTLVKKTSDNQQTIRFCVVVLGFAPLEGSNYCIDDDLPGMQKRAGTIACKNNVQLPSDSFMFLEHQGFAYNFFLLQDGDDPTIYELVDGQRAIERVNLAFSQWLSDVVDRHLAILEDKAKHNPLFDKPKR